ncbi:TetR family transcriptional regulator [Streptomyces albus subsp. chlorinus]|uniref:TetR/AcrR family transcriptional regulator n=1 Tax=Streptomyces albus TaxID=1888 RepID=UPI001570CE3A|nr:TetR family transcriptional regulator [Streptomyces albus]NSC23604.1 TetR family transcriptional regulator [Streptomyces albus subsp. chlorinus]
MAPARTRSADHACADLPPAKLSLRERKKIQTRQAIRRAAYRLFQEQGYDATPVDQIADEAEVSPSTVFRYFPTKEDIVLTDEYDALVEDALRSRPAGEPPVAALREALYSSLARIYQSDAEETFQRIRLIGEVPALRARMSEHSADTAWLLRRTLAERAGRSEDDLELRIVTGAMLGALTEAMYFWVDTGMPGTLDDLRALVNRALGVLERGLTL